MLHFGSVNDSPVVVSNFRCTPSFTSSLNTKTPTVNTAHCHVQVVLLIQEEKKKTVEF